ncbi:unnamed protein product [Ectocarpus sp. 12 AP-2014]
MVESGLMQAVVIVVGLTVLVMVCILFQGRPRPNAFSPEQLGQLRIDREMAKEALLEEKAQRLKERARIHRHNRLVLTARKSAGRLLHGAQERWDARGRSIYGDAWDDPHDGNVPLRTLFNLPKEEIDSIREEASRLLESQRPAGDFSLLPTPPGQQRRARDGSASSVSRTTDFAKEDHRAMTAPARRGPAYGSSRSPTAAPFVDSRFVHLSTSPAVVPPLDLARLNNDPSQLRSGDTCSYSAAKGGEMLRDRLPTQDGNPNSRHRMRVQAHNSPTSDHTTRDEQDLHGGPAVISSFQAPGLTRPKPPAIPFPRAKPETESKELGRESLSARLARLAAGRTPGRVVPVELV